MTDQTRDPMFGTLQEQPREGALSNRFRRGRRAREGRIHRRLDSSRADGTAGAAAPRHTKPYAIRPGRAVAPRRARQRVQAPPADRDQDRLEPAQPAAPQQKIVPANAGQLGAQTPDRPFAGLTGRQGKETTHVNATRDRVRHRRQPRPRPQHGLDQVTAFFSKFPETAPSDVPQLLDTKMIKVFEDAAS